MFLDLGPLFVSFGREDAATYEPALCFAAVVHSNGDIP